MSIGLPSSISHSQVLAFKPKFTSDFAGGRLQLYVFVFFFIMKLDHGCNTNNLNDLITIIDVTYYLIDKLFL